MSTFRECHHAAFMNVNCIIEPVYPITVLDTHPSRSLLTAKKKMQGLQWKQVLIMQTPSVLRVETDPTKCHTLLLVQCLSNSTDSLHSFQNVLLFQPPKAEAHVIKEIVLHGALIASHHHNLVVEAHLCKLLHLLL